MPFFIFGFYLALAIISIIFLLKTLDPKTLKQNLKIRFNEWLVGFTFSFFISIVLWCIAQKLYHKYIAPLSLFKNISQILYIYSITFFETNIFTIFPLKLFFRKFSIQEIYKKWYLIPFIALFSSIIVFPAHIHSWDGVLGGLLAWLSYMGINISYIILKIFNMKGYRFPCDAIACDTHFFIDFMAIYFKYFYIFI